MTRAEKVPPCNPLPDSVPFHPAREMSIETSATQKGKFDVYVDDIITIATDIKESPERITKSSVIVMHAVADNAIMMGTSIKCSDILQQMIKWKQKKRS